MVRFRNPGSLAQTHILVLKELYKHFGPHPFHYRDMAKVISNANLLTSYGYSGDVAIGFSVEKDASKKSPDMNAKMYAEIFRMLGWVTPLNPNDSYPIIITYIGIHIALSKNFTKLYEECVLGIVTPNQLAENLKYTEKVRIAKCIISSIKDLDGMMYKHELCLGPMSVNDVSKNAYAKMIKSIKELRGNYINLERNFKRLANSLHMKESSVDNCTRFPIGILRECNIIEDVTTKQLYNKSLKCIKLSNHGNEIYDEFQNMKDIRLEEFITYEKPIQLALIRLGIYRMLKRSGYNLNAVQKVIDKDINICHNILGGKDILFSPYQTIRHELIDEALELNIYDKTMETNKDVQYNYFFPVVTKTEYKSSILLMNIQKNIPKSLSNSKEFIEFHNILVPYKNTKKTNRDIVDILFDKYKTAKQDTFYPLIALLMKISGFNCICSRQGDNGSRWDAIIIDDKRSIPIEIKSPTESEFLTLKGIKQALENKIVLLSRKTYETTSNTTSLAVCYKMPTERSEANDLIDAIYKTYGYNIGIIDFKSLLTIAVSILFDNKGFDKNTLYELRGLINADFSKK